MSRWWELSDGQGRQDPCSNGACIPAGRVGWLGGGGKTKNSTINSR